MWPSGSVPRGPRLPWWWWLGKGQRCCFLGLGACLRLSSGFCAFHVGRREALCLLHLIVLSGSSRSPFAFSPVLALFLEHLIGDACTPHSLPSSRCLLAWSSQSCVQVRDGGRVTVEQGGPQEPELELEPGRLGWVRAEWMLGGVSVTSRLKNTHCSHLWRLFTLYLPGVHRSCCELLATISPWAALEAST